MKNVFLRMLNNLLVIRAMGLKSYIRYKHGIYEEGFDYNVKD